MPLARIATGNCVPGVQRAGDYKVAFTATELAQLNSIFPDGVCDWSKPGVNQSPSDGPWIIFGDTPGTWSLLGY